MCTEGNETVTLGKSTSAYIFWRDHFQPFFGWRVGEQLLLWGDRGPEEREIVLLTNNNIPFPLGNGTADLLQRSAPTTSGIREEDWTGLSLPYARGNKELSPKPAEVRSGAHLSKRETNRGQEPTNVL